MGFAIIPPLLPASYILLSLGEPNSCPPDQITWLFRCFLSSLQLCAFLCNLYFKVTDDDIYLGVPGSCINLLFITEKKTQFLKYQNKEASLAWWMVAWEEPEWETVSEAYFLKQFSLLVINTGFYKIWIILFLQKAEPSISNYISQSPTA